MFFFLFNCFVSTHVSRRMTMSLGETDPWMYHGRRRTSYKSGMSSSVRHLKERKCVKMW